MTRRSAPGLPRARFPSWSTRSVGRGSPAPNGWEAEVAWLAAESDAEAVESNAAAALQRVEKRLAAAEQAAARARVETVSLQQRVGERDVVIDGLRSDVVKLAETIDELRVQLTDTRLEARHAPLTARSLPWQS